MAAHPGDRRFRKVMWGPSGAISENMPRTVRMDNLASTGLASGTLLIVAGCELRAGEICTGVGFVSGATALGTPTSRWGLLLDINRKVLAVSANQGSAAWAATSSKTHDMATPYEAPTDMAVYAGLLIVATTMPSLYGADTQNSVMSLIAPKLAVYDATGMSGLSSPPAVGTTLASNGGAGRQIPYCWIY